MDRQECEEAQTMRKAAENYQRSEKRARQRVREHRTNDQAEQESRCRLENAEPNREISLVERMQTKNTDIQHASAPFPGLQLSIAIHESLNQEQ